MKGIKSNFGFVNCEESALGTLLVLLYLNDIKHAFGCDNVNLFADDIFLFMNDRNFDVVKEKPGDLFEKKVDGMLSTNYRLT